MIFLITLQCFFDVALVYLAIQWLGSLKKHSSLATQEISPSTLLQEKSAEWELEIQKYREKFEESLKTLHGICEQANRILRQNKPLISLHSREENELKEASLEKPSQKIPSLEQIENTKIRLKSDIPIDLKTLLKDQLA